MGAAGKEALSRLHATNGAPYDTPERPPQIPGASCSGQDTGGRHRIEPVELAGCDGCPGGERQPLKKLEPDEAGLLRLLQRWRDEATKGGCVIDRDAGAYEAGRDGFWLA